MKPGELKTLIKTLRAMGVVSYEAEGVKLLLDPNFIQPTKSRKSKAQQPQNLQSQIDSLVPRMSEEDWLLAGVSPEDAN